MKNSKKNSNTIRAPGHHTFNKFNQDTDNYANDDPYHPERSNRNEQHQNFDNRKNKNPSNSNQNMFQKNSEYQNSHRESRQNHRDLMDDYQQDIDNHNYDSKDRNDYTNYISSKSRNEHKDTNYSIRMNDKSINSYLDNREFDSHYRYPGNKKDLYRGMKTQEDCIDQLKQKNEQYKKLLEFNYEDDEIFIKKKNESGETTELENTNSSYYNRSTKNSFKHLHSENVNQLTSFKKKRETSVKKEASSKGWFESILEKLGCTQSMN